MTSLANSAQFPAGVGREINKYMFVWNDDTGKDMAK